LLAASVKALRNGLDGFSQGIRQLGDIFGLGFRERVFPFPPQEIIADLGELTVLFRNRRTLTVPDFLPQGP
jgi:hypothetical protein